MYETLSVSIGKCYWQRDISCTWESRLVEGAVVNEPISVWLSLTRFARNSNRATRGARPLYHEQF
jgi:hypothetical protein